MPAAAFVAGAAVQNAHNASLIAQQAATVAEQQTLEANQARHYASFVEAQATQALQQAEATLLETRAKAEAYVARAEANVRNTQQQAQAFAASVDQEREQFQAQLNSRAQQWARGVEADARLRVQQLQHQTEQYMSAQQDTVRNLQQHNAVLEQQLLAERSPVPNSPKSPMTQILTGSQLSTPVMAYGKDPGEGNPFAVSMQLEPPPGLLPQDAQPSLPLTPKGPHRPQEYYIGSVRGTPPGSVAPADGHAGQVASLEAQVSSLQDTVRLLAGHLQSLLNAPKTMTPNVISSGPTLGVPVPPPPPPPAMLMPPPPPPLPPHAAAPVPGTAAVALMPIRFVPPERLQPLGAIDATPAETAPDPVSDEEYTPSVAADDVSEPVESVEDASHRSSAVGSETAEAFAGGIPPHPDDDKTLIELAYDGDEARIADDPTMLKKAAFEEPHILTHYPKNPFCPVCQISKSTSKRVSRKPDVKDDDFIDPPKGPYEQLSTDDVIMAKGEDFAGKGVGGVKAFHVVRDTYSGARIAYPMSKRDASTHSKNFRHFLGLKANEVATRVLVKMDEAGELEQAAHEVGLIPETSLPNRWPHNAMMERDIREEKECCRAIHLQSGLPYSFHTHSYPFACLSMSFDRPSALEPAKTQWEALTRKPFDGMRHSFGQLMYYRDKRVSKRTLEPNVSPCLFLGWRIDAGFRYRYVVRVLDYMDYKVSEHINVQEVPEAEICVEDGPPCFPMASVKLAHLKGGSLGVLDDLARLDMPDIPMKEIPFGLEGADAVPPTPMDPKTRGVYITLDRIIRFSETPGCKACEKKTRYHTPACRKRFAKLVDEERRDLLAKRKEGITVEELPPREPETAPPTDSSESVTEDEPHVIDATPTVISGLSLTPHTTYRTQLIHTRPESGVPVFGMPSTAQPAQVSKKKKKKKPRKARPGRCMFEFACASDSQMRETFLEMGIPHIALSKEHLDLDDPQMQAQLHHHLSTCDEIPDLWASIPCTSGSPWQRVNRMKGGLNFMKRHALQVKESKRLFAEFAKSAELTLAREGTVTFEWPKGCESWQRTDVKHFFDSHPEFVPVEFDGCAVGVKSTKGRPIKKRWRLMTTSRAIVDMFSQFQCTHKPHEHDQAVGSQTARTAFYPRQMTVQIAKALYPSMSFSHHAPAMPCFSCTHEHEHRDKEQTLKHVSALSGIDAMAIAVETDDTVGQMVEGLMDISALTHEAYQIPKTDDGKDQVAALVTKLLSRTEMLSDPEALQKVKDEAADLVNEGTWEYESVREKEHVRAEAKASGVSVHFGKLMTIASIKFYELAKELQKKKGRIVYRGDCAKDEHGAAAVYEELGANPTSVQGLNACLAYGSLPGNLCTAADAVKAYVQATLKSKYKTWIELPPELRPAWWRNKFVQPVVLLVKALYGHPDAGGMWEQHLKGILKKMGGEEIPEFPGNFWFSGPRLMLSTYVDDLTLAGPRENHQKFWSELTNVVNVEPPEPIYRMLGRNHIYAVVPDSGNTETAALRGSADALIFDMKDYAQQTTDLYKSVAGVDKIKSAQTPFLADGTFTTADEESPGELAPKACSILMKALWLARLARPDILKPINDLATKVQKWTRVHDKKLLRLVQYIQHSLEYRLTAVCGDDASELWLELFVDADFGGDQHDVKSTSGGYLVLKGPNTHYPLAWVSKRQTSTSRSTTESEVVSLAYSLYQEGLPSLQLWDKLLGRDVNLVIQEDNQATILVVRKGFSPKLRHISRTHKINLSSLKECIDDPSVEIKYIDTNEQAADIFTKALPPQKWFKALCLLGIRTDLKCLVPSKTDRSLPSSSKPS